ncbi:MAG: ski2-like helicase [Candidatus Syntrophoarchaeum caldarius]|uniref:Ski2-like helicase n=1 Tax=Candidatus Syntropharchaeum caldarium TaxID=1838285 RepID=A0A1F2PBS1_9EURY|nr:MAG: ski2-like helicase [Candidatus Syntrophoarchaeum caldarius]
MIKDMPEELPIEVLETRYGLWNSYVMTLKNKGYKEIWYPQIQAFENGALDNDNFIFISSPGSGKTLVAEVILIHSFLKSTKAGAYLVPLNELANEIYDDFKERMEYPEIGIHVTKSTMDDENLSELQRSNIMIMTYEKFDYHLRNHPELISDLGAVVIDEFHMISNKDRGAKLELILAQLMHRFPNIRIVGLSAVVPNGDEISDWLHAKLCDTSDWRKNPLYEGVYDHRNKVIRFYDHPERLSSEETIGDYERNPTHNLTIDFIMKEISREGLPQTLIFVPKRKDARDFAAEIQRCLTEEIKERVDSYKLDKIATDLGNLEGSDTKTLKGLIEAVKNGIAFHHAGLGSEIKRVVMDAFRNQDLLVMISTTTLSAGVNLPAKRVIISEPRIGGRGNSGRDLTVAEYKNLAGRAGRPKYTDEHGECVIISKTPIFAESYKNRYILAEPEEIESRIDLSEDYGSLLNLLRDYPSVDKLVKIMEKTFYGYKGLNHEDLRLSVEIGVEKLENWDFVERDGELFNLTELGKSVSKQIINPFSAHIILRSLRNYLDRDIDQGLIQDILLTVCSTPEFDESNRFWRPGYYPNREEVKKKFGLDPLDLKEVDRVILTTEIIKKYISEESYSEIFKIEGLDAEYWAPSDIKERIAPRFSTTIRAMQQIIEESETELHNKFGELLDKLGIMTLYGIKEEHVDFVRKGITSDRNMIIFLDKIGIADPSKLLNVDIRWLSAQLAEKALKLKRRAVYNLLEDPEREKELILLEAYEKGIELSLFENLFTSSENQFWFAVKNILSHMDDIFEVHDHHVGSDSIPEADVYLKNEDGSLLKGSDGNPIKVCLECKSTRSLDKPVKTSTALEVLKKCPEGKYTSRVVIGTPSFEGDAGRRAKEHGILLVPVTVFARLFLLKEASKIDAKIIETTLQKTGELTIEKLNENLKGG